MSHIFAVLLILLPSFPFITAKVDEAIIRTAAKEYIGDGQILKHYSDGKDTVTVLFTAENEILECHVDKADSKVAQNLLHQAVENPLSENQYLFQEDVARIGRRCLKMNRDLKRSPEKDRSLLQQRTFTRLQLDAVLPTSEFCARQRVPQKEEPKQQPTPTKKENQNETAVNDDVDTVVPEEMEIVVNLDTCCKPWQLCEDTIDALSIKNNLFNPFPWPLRSCQCEKDFRMCFDEVLPKLDTAQAETARVFRDAYFGELKPKCFDMSKHKACAEYDFWHIHCLKEEDVDQFIMREI